MKYLSWLASLMILVLAASHPVMAASAPAGAPAPDLTGSWYGIAALIVFIVAYLLVIGEEMLHLRKSKPVMVAAGIIWILVALGLARVGDTTTAHRVLNHNLLEYAQLFLFLLAAMTYINALQERDVFNALRAWMVSRGLSLRAVYWVTGVLAFFISPVADNLTTTLLMAAVAMAVGAGNRQFVVLSCISIVVAANAGGAFSPFGDITTLMVWQAGIVQFQEFFALFIPSAVNWLVPAAIMSMFLPQGHPEAIQTTVTIRQGGIVIMVLFLCTIALAVSMHNFLHLPPVLGMMTGLGVLKLYGYRIRMSEVPGPEEEGLEFTSAVTERKPFDIFHQMERAEWDTLMFFYGVILGVGGLGALGYLALASESLYVGLGATWANVIVGVLSAIVDNIPVMFAVLTMLPEMGHEQWLLVTLTTGVGGSLLSVGSAAGVALMGQARGIYTFFAHLKWAWAIALGYAASIYAHILINGTG
jgi:Na+/H+ antiporter NhaD/arsenite permease-like protein